MEGGGYQNDQHTQDWDSGPLSSNIIKYIVHGSVFSVGMFVFPFILEFLLLGSLYSGFYTEILVLIIGSFLALVGVFGAINSYFARLFWKINPRSTVTSYLGQGFLILFMIPLFGTFLYFAIAVFGTAGFLFGIVLVLIDAFVSGYIGKHVAAEFEGDRARSEELASVSDRHKLCPHCGSRFMIRTSMIMPGGTVTCTHCSKLVNIPKEGPHPESSYDSW